MLSSRSEDPLHGVSREGVDEEEDDEDQGGEQEGFQDHPLVVVPDDVADRLEGVQEPDERGIGAAGIDSWCY